MTYVVPNISMMIFSVIGIAITILVFTVYKGKKGVNILYSPFVIIIILFIFLLFYGLDGNPRDNIDHQLTPYGSISSVNVTSSTNVTIEFGQFYGDKISQSDFRCFIEYEISSSNYRTFYRTFAYFNLSDGESSPIEMQSSESNVTAFFTNGDPSTDELGPGDFIDITGLTPGITYNIVLYHPSTEACVILQNIGYFTMPVE